MGSHSPICCLLVDCWFCPCHLAAGEPLLLFELIKCDEHQPLVVWLRLSRTLVLHGEDVGHHQMRFSVVGQGCARFFHGIREVAVFFIADPEPAYFLKTELVGFGGGQTNEVQLNRRDMAFAPLYERLI